MPTELDKLAEHASRLQAQGHYARAEKVLIAAIRLARGEHGLVHTETLRLVMNLGVSQRRQGKSVAAIETLHRVAKLLARRVDVPEDLLLYRATLNNLATAHHMADGYEEAEAAWRLCLDLANQLPFDPRAQEERARVLDNLAELFAARGRFDDSEAFARQALQEWRALRAEDDLDVAVSLSHIGLACLARGALDESREHLNASLQLTKEFAGEEHPSVGAVLNLIGMLEGQSGRFEAAMVCFERSLALSRELTDDHPQVQIARARLEDARQAARGR